MLSSIGQTMITLQTSTEARLAPGSTVKVYRVMSTVQRCSSITVLIIDFTEIPNGQALSMSTCTVQLCSLVFSTFVLLAGEEDETHVCQPNAKIFVMKPENWRLSPTYNFQPRS